MNTITRFLQKTYYWSKLQKLNIEKPIFVLTYDVDSTLLSEKQIDSLRTNLNIAKTYEVPCWIFVAPDPVNNLKNLCDKIKKWSGKVIIGSHGLKHAPFSDLSYEEQLYQLVTSKKIFKKEGIDVFSVRTPYLSLNKHLYQAVSKAGFKLDFSTSFGVPAKLLSFYLQPRKLKETIFIPLTLPAGVDLRKQKKSAQEMSSVWISHSKSILAKHGILSFLIHPATFVETSALESLLKFVTQQNIDYLNEDWKYLLEKK